jgi:hypothetical protein
METLTYLEVVEPLDLLDQKGLLVLLEPLVLLVLQE